MAAEEVSGKETSGEDSPQTAETRQDVCVARAVSPSASCFESDAPSASESQANERKLRRGFSVRERYGSRVPFSISEFVRLRSHV